MCHGRRLELMELWQRCKYTVVSDRWRGICGLACIYGSDTMLWQLSQLKQTHASKKMLTRIKVACSMSGLCPAWWFYQWLVEARWPTSLFTKFCTFHPCGISAWTKTLISLRIIHLCMSVHNLHIIFIILSTNPERFWAKSKWSKAVRWSSFPQPVVTSWLLSHWWKWFIITILFATEQVHPGKV